MVSTVTAIVVFILANICPRPAIPANATGVDNWPSNRIGVGVSLQTSKRRNFSPDDDSLSNDPEPTEVEKHILEPNAKFLDQINNDGKKTDVSVTIYHHQAIQDPVYGDEKRKITNLYGNGFGVHYGYDLDGKYSRERGYQFEKGLGQEICHHSQDCDHEWKPAEKADTALQQHIVRLMKHNSAVDLQKPPQQRPQPDEPVINGNVFVPGNRPPNDSILPIPNESLASPNLRTNQISYYYPQRIEPNTTMVTFRFPSIKVRDENERRPIPDYHHQNSPFTPTLANVFMGNNNHHNHHRRPEIDGPSTNPIRNLILASIKDDIHHSWSQTKPRHAIYQYPKQQHHRKPMMISNDKIHNHWFIKPNIDYGPSWTNTGIDLSSSNNFQKHVSSYQGLNPYNTRRKPRFDFRG